MSLFELRRIEGLARIADHLGEESSGPPVPAAWGPGSWFRAGLAIFAVLIAALLIYRLLG